MASTLITGLVKTIIGNLQLSVTKDLELHRVVMVSPYSIFNSFTLLFKHLLYSNISLAS